MFWFSRVEEPCQDLATVSLQLPWQLAAYRYYNLYAPLQASITKKEWSIALGWFTCLGEQDASQRQISNLQPL